MYPISKQLYMDHVVMTGLGPLKSEIYILDFTFITDPQKILLFMYRDNSWSWVRDKGEI